MRKGFMLLAVLLLAGCAGTPTTYLALAPSGHARSDHTEVAALSVAAVDIPPSIDRRHLTTGTPPGVLHVAGNTEWAGPLGPMARIVLARDLAARLPGCNVLMPGDALPAGGAAAVHVTVQEFMADAAGKVTLLADWSVAAPSGQGRLAHGRFAQSVPGGARPAAQARTMSIALGRLADAIASALAQVPAGAVPAPG